ncbi:hypothetical protein [Candidatus Regiella insecticola]|uniref:Uncharacterized protein n=1 Tax=Candidatus Regiella insecticola TaxID=138073 RepID=A0A6L2ZLN5_9ENTR|nr:hypothetical protein [Candidatus Regiella insecticola]GFN45753.1 hypothetical protein RINTU1_10510 [Candidatus Regiella insecticola]
MELALHRKFPVEVIQALLIAGADPSGEDLSLAIRIGAPVEVIQKLKLAQKIPGTTVSLFKFMTEKDRNNLINYLEDPKIEKAVLQAIKDEDLQLSDLLQSQFEKTKQREVTNL